MIQVPTFANDIVFDLRQNWKHWLSYQQSDIIFLSLSHKNSGKNILKV